MVQQVFNFPYQENTNTDFCINKISLEQKRDFLHSLTGYGDGSHYPLYPSSTVPEPLIHYREKDCEAEIT